MLIRFDENLLYRCPDVAVQHLIKAYRLYVLMSQWLRLYYYVCFYCSKNHCDHQLYYLTDKQNTSTVFTVLSGHCRVCTVLPAWRTTPILDYLGIIKTADILFIGSASYVNTIPSWRTLTWGIALCMFRDRSQRRTNDQDFIINLVLLSVPLAICCHAAASSRATNDLVAKRIM